MKLNPTTAAKLAGLEPLRERLWLSSPTMHGEEQRWVDEAIRTNWVSTVGENIDEVERLAAERVGAKHAVGLSCGTAALHLATRLAAERLYGQARPHEGTLAGRRAFCSDVTFDASVNPVAYEGGEAVFVDTERDSWNMDPAALERAFALYPDVRLVVVAHLYGTPAKMDKIRAICDAHDALLVEDAAESLGARCRLGEAWVETGAIGDYNAVSFNGNKVITGSAGGLLLTDSKADADRARKWSTQAREAAPWYQHEELGYNYRMSNVVAGVVRGQLPHLDEHVAQKRAIYERYRDAFAGLPVSMNPYDPEACEPNFWLSCLLIDEEAMAPMVRGERDYLYTCEPGKSSPQEILDALASLNCEGRPVWKPMHLQPVYRANAFVTREGSGRGTTNAYIAGGGQDVGADLFRRGLCLPSDNKMTHAQQDLVVECVRRCFGEA